MSKINTSSSEPTFSSRGDQGSQPKPLIVGLIFMLLFVVAILFFTL